MMRTKAKVSSFFLLLALCVLPGAPGTLHADNRVLGKIQFVAIDKPAKSSGVWIDGQYVGYLKELKGSRQILLLPGRHEIAVKQDGFMDFRQSVIVQPGEDLSIEVAMRKNPHSLYPTDASSSQVKLDVDPDRAAVFVDDRFVGHAGEFGGLGRGMVLTPGQHQIVIDLPGYRTFATTIDLLPGQKMVLKTQLLKGSIEQADPLVRAGAR
ncbi:MAG TPA: PEGA domain-containing protein [Candidatus Acidoferrales bacterium]|nr:PEGA domain-containing protein [Candidatus Acidoferrales bacterium]